MEQEQSINIARVIKTSLVIVNLLYGIEFLQRIYREILQREILFFWNFKTSKIFNPSIISIFCCLRKKNSEDTEFENLRMMNFFKQKSLKERKKQLIIEYKIDSQQLFEKLC